MTRGPVSAAVVTDRAAWIRRMLAGIRALPVGSHDEFMASRETQAAAESYLRRALEALLDLGRHILSKGFARGVAEYRSIPMALVEEGVLAADDADLMVRLAGYRNRMVHFYHAVGDEEPRLLCRDRLGDLERVLDALLAWVRADPARLDQDL